MNYHRKKKILYAITKSNWGGAQRYLFDLATNLNPETVDVIVALGGAGELKKRLETNNIRCISLKKLERDINIFKEISLFFTLLSLYRRERPDIIHLNSSKIGGVGSLAGRIYNLLSHRPAKIIFTAHGWAFEEHRNKLAKTIIWIVSWITVVCSHKTIGVSKHQKKPRMPWVSHKIVTIHNGIEPATYMRKEDARKKIIENIPALSAYARTFLLNPDTHWIGTIGELHPNKGFPYALHAINALTATLQNIAYIIIGDGEQRDSILQYIQSKNLHDHVFLVGYIPHAENYVQAFDIFLLPSIKEGFPYVLLESAHARIPIIATAIGGIPEIIEHKHSGMLARPQNSEDIQENIRYMLAEQYRREKMADALYRKVTKNFGIKNMLEKTWGLYRTVLLKQKKNQSPSYSTSAAFPSSRNPARE